MSSLLNVIDELDDLLFNGRQKNERRVAVDLHNILFSFGLSINHNHVAQRLPYVIRNQEVSLKDEQVRTQIFPLLRQESTEIDILFINAPSPLGHGAKLNYYVEVETQRRDALASQRLLNFSAFCKRKGIDLFPILVVDIEASRYMEDICIMNMDELRKMGAFYERYMNDIEQIPGLAFDDAASCFYIMDLMSKKGIIIKEELHEELRRHPILWRKTINFKKFATEKASLDDCLEPETSANFNQRMLEYIKKLKENGLIEDADIRSHQLTPSGGKCILKWRGGI